MWRYDQTSSFILLQSFVTKADTPSDCLVVVTIFCSFLQSMRQHAWKVLDRAYAAGVRYFDAARSYGMSEDFLAGWLQSREIKSEDVVVGSKWGYYYTADWAVDTNGV